MRKLWEKSTEVDRQVELFTIGQDKELDILLAKYDALGSLAHIAMLESIGLLESNELEILSKELKAIYQSAGKDEFTIDDKVEDVHSQIELMLTKKLGEVGKKIHSGRSRNDQVLLDLKLYTRAELEQLVGKVNTLINTLLNQSNKYKNILLPGYTHLQIAMPSSFGLWFGAYAESLADDLQLILSAWKITNRNPLGSAAGYGSSFPINRQMTTDLLGFDNMNFNVVYAQMGRGKMERTVASALASVAATLAKLAYDVCLFSSQNFSFIQLAEKFTTGSSIMPHKKNPDVFELTRAKCNKIQSVPHQITLIINNLPSGYFRDLQVIKEVFLPMFVELNSCLDMTDMMMQNVEVNNRILEDEKYNYLFSVEEVNRRVMDGMPFRDAYKSVGAEIENKNFKPDKNINHTHEGSIGNLCNEQISAYRDGVLSQFHFEKVNDAIRNLVSEKTR